MVGLCPSRPGGSHRSLDGWGRCGCFGSGTRTPRGAWGRQGRTWLSCPFWAGLSHTCGTGYLIRASVCPRAVSAQASPPSRPRQAGDRTQVSSSPSARALTDGLILIRPWDQQKCHCTQNKKRRKTNPGGTSQRYWRRVSHCWRELELGNVPGTSISGLSRCGSVLTSRPPTTHTWHR